MERLSARRTVPQIFIDGQSIGGYDDIRLLDATGDLDRLLGKSTKLAAKIHRIGTAGEFCLNPQCDIRRVE